MTTDGFKAPGRFATAAIAAALGTALAAFSAAQASATPLSSLLDAQAAARLVAGESLRTSSAGRAAAPSIAPVHPAAAGLAAAIAAETPDVVVEALFLWKRPHPADPAAETLAVYNVLRAISSLRGIEYWSDSKGRMRLLYEYSSLVAGPDDRTPVTDSRLAAMPSSETLFARQKDLSFGDNVYRISLSTGPGFVTQSSTNLTRMSVGIVPVAAPGDVSVRLLVVSADEGIVFYTASSARAAILPGVRGKLESSFGNRAAAVYAWFSRELAKAWPAR